MMIKICPRCKLEIAEERHNGAPTICDCCGFVLSQSEVNLRKNVEKSVLRTAVIASVVMVVSFMHISTWGDHSLEVIPLKASEMLGSLSPGDTERLAQIGLDLKKYDLTEKMYARQARVDSRNFVRLAKFQMSRNEFKEAAASFGQFFNAKQENVEARFDYAKALGSIGQIDEAAKNFEYVLHAKPDVRQVTVVQTYVKMLVQNNRFDQAQKVIEDVRKRDPSASTFMDTEYKVIAERAKTKT